MSQRAFVDPSGRLLIGKHKGSHYSAVPALWLEWARENIQGLSDQIESIKNRPKPTGRIYILKPYKRNGPERTRP